MLRRGFLAGTYGWDTLSKVLFLTGILFLPSRHIFLFGAVIMLYAFIRTLSKNFDKRYKEEAAFQHLLQSMKYTLSNIKSRYNNGVYNRKQKKNFVIIACPRCSQKLRLPKHKGNIVVTCKKCSYEFKSKT